MPGPAHRQSSHRVAQLAERAARMRHVPTPSEARLWEALPGGRLGVVFQRQVVVGECIADFCAPSIRLIVEVDGGYHAERERLDARRDERLRRLRYCVVRVSSAEVGRELPAVVARLRAVVRALLA